MTTLNSIREQLNTQWQMLQSSWQAARAQWNDSVAQQFDREFLQPYQQTIPATLQAMQKLAEVIVQARRNVK